MEFEQDYIMRMIKSIVSFFIKLITGKSDTVYELPSDGLYTPCDDIFARILSLADGGKINEAENLLYANVEPDSKDYLLMGLTFYSHIIGSQLQPPGDSRWNHRFYKRIYNRRNELPITLSDTGRNVIKQKHESGNE